jgi:Holin family.
MDKQIAIDNNIKLKLSYMNILKATYMYLLEGVSTWKIFISSILLSPFVLAFQNFIEVHIFRDWDLLIALGMLWIMDNITGTWAAIKGGKFNGKLWLMLNFEKTAAYIIWIALFGVLKTSINTKEWLGLIIGNTCITVLIIREAISVGENLLLIRPDRKLEKLLTKIKTFFDVKQND